ncbi:Nucleoside diphosphate kinase [uncultured archaeon]|nr:Nucleoside diphosphate kinase [uncultured archaeon]
MVKPAAIAESALGKIIQSIEKEGLSIAGMKMQSIDIHYLQNKLDRERREEQKEQILLAKKVPAVLIVVYGERESEAARKLEEEFLWKVHVSKNEEVAKYELARFFKDEEIFEYAKNLHGIIFEKEEKGIKFWSKNKTKSVEEIEKESKTRK